MTGYLFQLTWTEHGKAHQLGFSGLIEALTESEKIASRHDVSSAVLSGPLPTAWNQQHDPD